MLQALSCAPSMEAARQRLPPAPACCAALAELGQAKMLGNTFQVLGPEPGEQGDRPRSSMVSMGGV
jgi:hypothetical protein